MVAVIIRLHVFNVIFCNLAKNPTLSICHYTHNVYQVPFHFWALLCVDSSSTPTLCLQPGYCVQIIHYFPLTFLTNVEKWPCFNAHCKRVLKIAITCPCSHVVLRTSSRGSILSGYTFLFLLFMIL